MKSKQQKREEAIQRASKYSYEGSKAERLQTSTKEEWEANNKSIYSKKVK